jgi:hypothetical protein
MYAILCNDSGSKMCSLLDAKYNLSFLKRRALWALCHVASCKLLLPVLNVKVATVGGLSSSILMTSK